jgi:site-specific DNA recombinase
MNHKYTKKGNRRYRYYVCDTAQKQGYQLCATKSVPAKAIEDFVVRQIKKIGTDPDVLKETANELKTELKSQVKSLANESNYLRKEQTMLKRQAKANGAENTADRIRLCEKRLSEINRQQLLLANTKISEKQLKKTLGLFDPIWDVLYPQEQARILKLLIEKNIYSGEKGSMTINFRPLGIKALADEANINKEAVA